VTFSLLSRHYRPQFSGYTQEPGSDGKKQVRLFLPGHAPDTLTFKNQNPSVEYKFQMGEPVKSIPLQWNPKRVAWESPQLLPFETIYRFIVDGKPKLDLQGSLEEKAKGARIADFSEDSFTTSKTYKVYKRLSQNSVMQGLEKKH
jgi:hypothetical protein